MLDLWVGWLIDIPSTWDNIRSAEFIWSSQYHPWVVYCIIVVTIAYPGSKSLNGNDQLQYIEMSS